MIKIKIRMGTKYDYGIIYLKVDLEKEAIMRCKIFQISHMTVETRPRNFACFSTFFLMWKENKTCQYEM